MTWKILLVMAAGIGLGRLASMLDPQLIETLFLVADIAIQGGLCVMLLAVGLELGGQRAILRMRPNLKMLLIPLLTMLGSILGGTIAALFLPLSFHEAWAVTASCGWYSFSGVYLTTIDPQWGTIAFLANVLRELTALLLIPHIAKWLHPYSAISVGGATAMDTSLPVLVQSAGKETTAPAFLSGLLLTLAVPFIVPLLAALTI